MNQPSPNGAQADEPFRVQMADRMKRLPPYLFARSVLERVREIGIMKAVGARDGHILTIFLIEGTLIGLAGGIAGTLLGWVASHPADAWVHSMVQRDMSIELHGTIFAFPWWLVLGVPVFATVVTTLAALFPARRAAQINPVAALRHE